MIPRWGSAARWSRRLLARLAVRQRRFGRRSFLVRLRLRRRAGAPALSRVWVRRALRTTMLSAIRVVPVTVAGSRLVVVSTRGAARGGAPRPGVGVDRPAIARLSPVTHGPERPPPPRTLLPRAGGRSVWVVRTPASPAAATIRYTRERRARRVGGPLPVAAPLRAPVGASAARTGPFVGTGGRPWRPARPPARDRVRHPAVRPSSLSRGSLLRAEVKVNAPVERPRFRLPAVAPARLVTRPLPQPAPRTRSIPTKTLAIAAPRLVGTPRVWAGVRRARPTPAPAGGAPHAPEPRYRDQRMSLLAGPRTSTVPPAWSVQQRPTSVTRPSALVADGRDEPSVVTPDVSAAMVELVDRTVEERVIRHIGTRSPAARALAAHVQRDLYESLQFERERLGD